MIMVQLASQAMDKFSLLLLCLHGGDFSAGNRDFLISVHACMAIKSFYELRAFFRPLLKVK